MVYVERKNLNVNLLNKGNEMQLIEHLNTQSKNFLKENVEKK